MVSLAPWITLKAKGWFSIILSNWLKRGLSGEAKQPIAMSAPAVNMADPNKVVDLAWLFVSLRRIIEPRIMLSISVTPRRMAGCTQLLEHAADANTNIIGDKSKTTSCKEVSKEEFALGSWIEYAIMVAITEEAVITVGTLQTADLIGFFDRSCVGISGVSEERSVGRPGVRRRGQNVNF